MVVLLQDSSLLQELFALVLGQSVSAGLHSHHHVLWGVDALVHLAKVTLQPDEQILKQQISYTETEEYNFTKTAKLHFYKMEKYNFVKQKL